MFTAPARILIVDDTATNRLVLERMVAAQGHSSMSAEHGAEALALLRCKDFDMVLLDIMMPQMNGFQLLTKMREDPELQHVPVVVTSADTDIESVARCIELGASDYLFKPVDRRLLEARINSCVAQRRLREREQAAYMATLAAHQERNEFIALVSHELRNPLTAILVHSEELQFGMLGQINDDQTEALRTIGMLIKHMANLLSDLSDISHIESGHLALVYNEFNVSTACNMAVQVVAQAIREKEQQLSITIPAGLPNLRADLMRTVQILTNLLNNASKYTQIGGSIAMSVRYIDTGMLEFEVQDNGLGISAADQRHVFDKFFRAPDLEARKETGTGLGMYVTRLLVEAQGGAIWFKSSFRVGTTFYVTLPAATQPRDGDMVVGLDGRALMSDSRFPPL
ncbi:MAG: hybrid sensor histidine kinase/response regulator [Oscillochloris sp.]|nr:hybrid sensor histidine kinase/response regulator [Oscillochloris sp.]